MGQSYGHPSTAAAGAATFLDLPARPAKPRTTGLTHVLDPGYPHAALEGLLESAGWIIDLWKFGFGTAYVDPAVTSKVALLDRHGVTACVGGTLLEVAWLQDRAAQCLAWAADVGFRCVEVSNGVARMSLEDKRRLIKLAASDFTVIAEVGSKDARTPVEPLAWRDEMLGDLAAGATWGMAEGRASGTIGLYRADGSVREELAHVLSSAVGLSQLIFEAPRTAQQAWFVGNFGSNVNLGNITVADALALETLRVGLRAETLEHTRPDAPRTHTP